MSQATTVYPMHPSHWSILRAHVKIQAEQQLEHRSSHNHNHNHHGNVNDNTQWNVFLYWLVHSWSCNNHPSSLYETAREVAAYFLEESCVTTRRISYQTSVRKYISSLHGARLLLEAISTNSFFIFCTIFFNYSFSFLFERTWWEVMKKTISEVVVDSDSQCLCSWCRSPMITVDMWRVREWQIEQSCSNFEQISHFAIFVAFGSLCT
jgi:hypothetical protein